jgi:predicted anti-sigma-YlaC factor YlaD
MRVRRELSTGPLPRSCRLPLALVLVIAVGAAGCSIRKLAVNALGRSLVEASDVFASDEDPELVRDALPFALKIIEALLEEQPDHQELLVAACRGFTQYAFAFVDSEATLMETTDYYEAERLRDRALQLYLRALGYGLRALELRAPGIEERLRLDPEGGLDEFTVADIATLYWTGAAWGAAISLGKDRPALLADLPAVRALMSRTLELDEAYGQGAIHEVFIVLAALRPEMGGSAAEAKQHFQRAVTLSGGARAGPYVTYAENISVMSQNRDEFESLLQKALQIDPDQEPGSRLENLIIQRRARSRLEHAEELFFDDGLLEEGESP